MKRLILIFVSSVILPVISREQVQSVLPVATANNGALTAVAYDWSVIGVNPANLGWSINHTLSFTFLDMGVSGQSEGMSFPSLMSAFHSSNLISSANSWQQILGAPGGMNTNADINWFAVSFRLPQVPGAFAVNMRDRIEGNGFLGINASQAIMNSDNNVYDDQAILSFLDGTTLKYIHYREINVDYGLPLYVPNGVDNTSPDLTKCFNFNSRNNQTAFYGGIGFKYLMGIADINSGILTDGIDATYNMNDNYPDIPGGFFNTPGHGFAFDLGLSAIYQRWKFGWSFTDLGSITWKHTLATTGDTNVATIRHGSDVINELENGTLAGTQPAPDYTTSLPAKMRLGISYKLTSLILLSSDFIMPLNQTSFGPSGPYFALGTQIKTSKYITICAGFAIATYYGWSIPLGITYSINKHIDFYLGTNDITGIIGKTNNADVSTAVGLFTFNL